MTGFWFSVAFARLLSSAAFARLLGPLRYPSLASANSICACSRRLTDSTWYPDSLLGNRVRGSERSGVVRVVSCMQLRLEVWQAPAVNDQVIPIKIQGL